METTNEKKKPTVKLIGQDSNVFNLIGLASQALKRAGMREEAEKMTNECFKAEDYDHVIQIIMKYCYVK